jgi:uncharacterized protein YjbJ (UPF0337 family)
MIGISNTCGNWYLFDSIPGTDDAVMVRLPDADSFPKGLVDQPKGLRALGMRSPPGCASRSARLARGFIGRVPFRTRYVMIWYQLAADWKQFTSKVKQRWGQLTDDDLTTFGGKSDQLASILQRRYGFGRDQADREIREFSRDSQA